MKSKKSTKASSKEYYVNPDEMWDEFEIFYEKLNNSDDPELVPMTESLGKMIDDIATKLGFMGRFINYCHRADDTKAFTKRGYLPVHEITLEDEVLSLDPSDNGLKWSSIKNIYINENYDGKLHYLKGKGFSAQVTPGHKFLLSTNEYKSVDELSEYDFIKVSGFSDESDIEVISVQDIDFNGGFVSGGDNIPTVEYKGTIWCIETEYGNFSVANTCEGEPTYYITGNSYKEEMIGDARIKMVKAVYDRNFSLWGDNFCSPVGGEDPERQYVQVYTWSREKKEWLNKRVYLKEWDTINYLSEPATGGPDDEVVMYHDEEGNEHPIMNTITMKNNPFSYFTRIAYHAFVNRIKKEKKVAEVLKLYQEKIYEEAYSSGNGWENVKRSAIEDENEYYYEDEEFYDDSEETFEEEQEESPLDK